MGTVVVPDGKVAAEPRPSHRWPFALEPHGVSVTVLVVALALVVTLALTARSLHDDNEQHLLRQRVAEAGAVLSAAIPDIQTPLASGAVLAEATSGDVAAFTKLMGPLASGQPFVSVTLWDVGVNGARPRATVGSKADLLAEPAPQVAAFLAQVARMKAVSVLDLLGRPERRLGYGFSVGAGAHYVIYAESSLPENRRSNVDSNSAFSNLDYAIYLGAGETPGNLLAASRENLHFSGRTASTTVPFGNASLRIVMTPRGQLGGYLLANLPWLIGGIGIAIALAAAFVTERLARRRADAEALAALNARLFSEQRSVAQTLQHSLLPKKLPEFEGLEVDVRYVPGVDGVEIGGDWYDVIAVDDGSVLFAIGDVSGRGLRAATVMASLRFAIRAYAADGDAPGAILDKLTKLIDVVRDDHFATVMCGVIDAGAHRMTVAAAGHPPPLLVHDGEAEFVAVPVGPPIGVTHSTYASVTVTVPPGATLLTYTDGLYERRSEHPDVSLERLRTAVANGEPALGDLLDGLLRVLTPDGAHDDTAILGLRWRN